MFKSNKIWLFCTIAFISGDILTSQISLSVILGLFFLYDFRFLSISLTLLGLGAGGVISSFFFEKINRNFSRNIFYISFLYAATTIIPFMFVNGFFLKNLSTSVILSASLISSIIHFLFGGLFLSLLYTHEKNLIHRLYFFDLIGAALAGIIIVFITDYFGLYSSIPFLFAVGAGASFFCWLYYSKPVFYKKITGAIGIIILILLINFKMPFYIECQKENLPTNKEWSNSFSNVKLQILNKKTDYIQFRTVVNCIMRPEGYIAHNIKNIRSYLDNFRFIPFQLNSPKKVLIVGSGPGIDVSRALLAGSEEITAVEINPLIINAANSFLREDGISPYQDKRVKTVTAEARSFILKTKETYDLILIAYANFGRSIGVQLFSPKHLFTKEAFEEYIKKLNKNGLLVILDHPNFTPQYLKTFSVFINHKEWDIQRKIISFSITTAEIIVFKKSDFLQIEKENAQKIAQYYHSNYDTNPLKEMLVNKSEILTDDKPFLRQSKIKSANREKEIETGFIPDLKIIKDFMIVVSISILITLGAVMLYLIKMAKRRQDSILPLFFIGISLGLSAFEFVLVNKVTLLLGNPVYSHAIAISSVLLFGGLGSLAVSYKKIPENIQAYAISMAAILLIYYAVIDYFIVFAMPFDYILKIPLTIAMIFPPSFLTGTLFPTALKKVGLRNNILLPWMWGIDALAFVTVSLIISFAVLFLGIKIMLIFGAIGYALAAVTARSL